MIKYNSIKLRALCCVLLVAVAASAERCCKSRIPFFEKCNICMCSEDGTSKSCTDMKCEPCIYNKIGKCIYQMYRAPSSDIEDAVTEVEIKCVPRKSFNINCNSCMCNADGITAVCTIKPCHFEPLFMSYTHKEESCIPGQMFRKHCNACICNSSGKKGSCSTHSCTIYNLPSP